MTHVKIMFVGPHGRCGAEQAGTVVVLSKGLYTVVGGRVGGRTDRLSHLSLTAERLCVGSTEQLKQLVHAVCCYGSALALC